MAKTSKNTTDSKSVRGANSDSMNDHRGSSKRKAKSAKQDVNDLEQLPEQLRDRTALKTRKHLRGVAVSHAKDEGPELKENVDDFLAASSSSADSSEITDELAWLVADQNKAEKMEKVSKTRASTRNTSARKGPVRKAKKSAAHMELLSDSGSDSDPQVAEWMPKSKLKRPLSDPDDTEHPPPQTKKNKVTKAAPTHGSRGGRSIRAAKVPRVPAASPSSPPPPPPRHTGRKLSTNKTSRKNPVAAQQHEPAAKEEDEARTTHQKKPATAQQVKVTTNQGVELAAPRATPKSALASAPKMASDKAPQESTAVLGPGVATVRLSKTKVTSIFDPSRINKPNPKIKTRKVPKSGVLARNVLAFFYLMDDGSNMIVKNGTEWDGHGPDRSEKYLITDLDELRLWRKHTIAGVARCMAIPEEELDDIILRKRLREEKRLRENIPEDVPVYLDDEETEEEILKRIMSDEYEDDVDMEDYDQMAKDPYTEDEVAQLNATMYW